MADIDKTETEISEKVVEPEKGNCRKRKDISSVNELDTSGTAGNSQNISGKSKKKKKKPKTATALAESTTSTKEGTSGGKTGQVATEMAVPSEMKRQLKEINNKLSNVITKDDGFLRGLIKEMFQQMKDEFLNSVHKRIDILEGKLFEKDEENDKLKKNISDLKKDIADKQDEIDERKAENIKLKEEIESMNINMESKMNDIEQYSRKNNIRISGLPEIGIETAEATTYNVVQEMNKTFPDLDLQPGHIDIAHRMGKKQKNRHRQIIVKFNSRMKKDQILQKRKLLKGTDIFISEDLTPTNQLVLACIRRKMPDEVQQSWSKGGRLYYKLKSDLSTVIEVPYKDFQTWISLPWPEKKSEES